MGKIDLGTAVMPRSKMYDFPSSSLMCRSDRLLVGVTMFICIERVLVQETKHRAAH